EHCWFSDGGICSNFPIHMSDSFIPRWPTFGIMLDKRSKHRPCADEAVWLPGHHREGRADFWNRFFEKTGAFGKLGGFLSAVVAAAQTWNDTTSARMPGVRDRVVRIRLSEKQGGLNLNMPAPLIDELAGYGRTAGIRLRERFLAD